jgi:hypothetical protein
MKTMFLALIATLLLTFSSNGQSQTASWLLNPSNKGVIYCPNTYQFYEAYISGQPAQTSCTYKWRVEGGYFPNNGNGTEATVYYNSNIAVIWTTTTATAKLYLTVIDCQNPNINVANVPFDFYLRTVSSETPTTTLSLPLQVEKGRRTVTFSVKPVQVPNTGQWGDVSGISTSIFADQYEWTLPINRPEWQFIGQPASQRFLLTNTPTVDM